MKIILTGATGAAGLEVLRAAIVDTSVTGITVLSRRALPAHIPVSEKVTRIEHSDFLTYPRELLTQLEGHGACIWALGKSSVGMVEEEYTRITYSYPLAALKAFDAAGIRGEDGKFRFVYISGEGARTDEKGAMFGRVKGRTEKDLATFAGKSSSLHVYNVRPGYFPTNPQDAAVTRPVSMRIVEKVIGPMFSALVPSMMIKTEDLAFFLKEAARGRMEPDTYSNVRMKQLLTEWKHKETE